LANNGFILLEEDALRISEILNAFLREADAKASLVIDRGGHPIAVEGQSASLDTISLSALAAGAFASTREIARLVGETEFTVLYHQGKKGHIHVSHVDADTLMMAIFDNKTTVGLVRLCSHETERKIAKVMEESRSRGRQNAMAGKTPVINIEGDIFGPGQTR
jgi:predicted regulator of Ras-like GTPase activity (Roadblock/LC7/MglB family)